MNTVSRSPIVVPGTSRSQPNVQLGWLAAAFIVGLLLLNTVIYVVQRAKTEQATYQTLEAIVQLKTEQTEEWIAEHMTDGDSLVAERNFVETVVRALSQTDSHALEHVRSHLKAEKLDSNYTSATIIDAKGKILFALDTPLAVLPQHLVLAKQAHLRGETIHGDLLADPSSGQTVIDFFVPLQSTTPGMQHRSMTLILRYMPQDDLFPKIQQWPIASTSAEVLLVRRIGDEVEYLNTLRFAKELPLTLRLPIARDDLPAAIALKSGKAGLASGYDYRQVAVMSAYKPVQGTEWALIAKINQNEALQPVWQLIAWISLVELLSGIFVGSGGYLLWRLQRKNSRLVHLADEAEIMRQSADHFRAVTDSSSDAIVTADADGRVVSWNPAGEQLFGYSPEEIIGQSLSTLVPERYRAAHAAGFSRVASGQPSRIVGRVVQLTGRHRSGREFPVELSIARWTSPRGQFFTGTLRDISERQRVEEESRKLLKAVEQSPVSIVITNRSGNIEYVNPRFCLTTGYSLPEVMGKNPGMLKSGETPPEVYADLWKTILSGAIWRNQLCNRRKNGKIYWEDVTICPIIDDQKNITHFLALQEDITLRKQTEEELEAYREHLEDMVDQRTNDLSEALRKAKLADQAKDAFLANVSHELRTPLNAVIGLSELARRSASDPKQHAYLDKIISAGKNLAHTVNDLLDLSKIAAGRMEFELIPFSMPSMIEHCRSLMLPRAAEKNIELLISIAPDVPEVLIGDPLRIEQIVLNLLSNAVKFTRVGKIDLHVRLDPAHRNVNDNRAAIDIRVMDTGIGMSEHDLSKLFVPFSQADASMSRKYGGTGLGLTICKRLAEAMDGEISVTSHLGAGTTFHLKIQLGIGTQNDLATITAHESAQDAVLPSAYANTTVLSVDDQPLNREIVRELLASVGIKSEEAREGQEALDILRKNGPDAFDVVLMDIQMPGMDGLEATRSLRTWPGFDSLPVIALTAHTMEHERQLSVAAGMNDHIGKPFEMDAFFRTLAKWIPVQKHLNEHAMSNSPPTQVISPGLAGLKSIDTAAGLARFLGKEDRYRHWLLEFSANAMDQIANIGTLIASAEMEQARQAAHSLKGRVGMLGMTQLHAMTAALEAAIKQHADDIQERLAQVQAATPLLCTEIRTALGATAIKAAENLPVPVGAPPECVTKITAMLEIGDGGCAREIELCIAKIDDLAWRALLEKALIQVRQFDFPEAHRILTPSASKSAHAS